MRARSAAGRPGAPIGRRSRACAALWPRPLDEARERAKMVQSKRRAHMCVPGCQEAVRNALSRRGFFTGAVAAGFAATAIAPEPAEAAPARRFKTTVDLTHTMSPDFPTFFGVPGIEMEKKFDIKKDGFNLYWWRIIEHAGTHLDAPIHFSEAGATAEKIPADTLVVPLAVVDVATKAAQ